MLGLQIQTTATAFCTLGDLNSGHPACMVRALSTEGSPQPLNLFIKDVASLSFQALENPL